jgi:hypothetical protein
MPNKNAFSLALAVTTAVLSLFLSLASVHTYCENRAGAAVLAAVAIAVSYIRVRSSTRNPLSRILSILTYLASAIALTINVWFIAFASKVCRDKFGWVWLPMILVSYAWLLLWTWLRWNNQLPRFPPPLIRSRAAFLGLLFGTLSALLLAAFWAYTYFFGYVTALNLPWAVFVYFNLGLAVLGFLLGFGGKGVFRISVVILSAVMVFAWWMELAIGRIASCKSAARQSYGRCVW